MEYEVGKCIYWNDPDDGICSGVYVVIEIIDDETLLVQNAEGSEVEILISEIEESEN